MGKTNGLNSGGIRRPTMIELKVFPAVLIAGCTSVIESLVQAVPLLVYCLLVSGALDATVCPALFTPTLFCPK